MTPDYNKIAPYYDLLSSIVFGNAIKKAQAGMLHFIPADCNILIAGGGTGWIIEKITSIHSSGLRITYIDASRKMIEKSKKRNPGFNKINFIISPAEAFDPGTSIYDIVITPFFLDNFSQETCLQIFHKLHMSVKRNGLWLYTDFNITPQGKYWQKPLLKIMYLFFRLICGLQVNQLPDTEHCFSVYKYQKIAEKSYYKGFITSTVFKSTGLNNLI